MTKRMCIIGQRTEIEIDLLKTQEYKYIIFDCGTIDSAYIS